MVRVSDLRIGSVVHLVDDRSASGIWVTDDTRVPFDGPPLAEVVPRIDALREELRNDAAVARGRVPKLQAFAEDWGRALLPPTALDGSADVLVIVPHALLHGLPLHLVHDDTGAPLGTRIGITYASSLSQFARCVERNASRQRDPAAWTFDHGDGDGVAGHYVPTSFRGGGTDVIADQGDAFRAIAARVATAIGMPEADIDGTTEPFGYGRMSIKGPLWRGFQIDVLCAVAHGLLDARDHRLSGLLMDRGPGVGSRPLPIDDETVIFPDRGMRPVTVGATGARRGEVLTTAELQLEAGATYQQVALLGCSAGWTRMLAGDEPASIAETFVHLGAPSVAAPLWDSHVDATGDWAEAFFTAWAQGGVPRALAASHAHAALHDAGLGPERAGVLALRGDWL
jgi:hypothetical protein